MSDPSKRKARIHYARVDEFWRKEEKYAYLDEVQHRGNVEWHEIQPDAKHSWLTEGMQDEFECFIPIGTKEAKGSAQTNGTVFRLFSGGVKTNRDQWVYNFDKQTLTSNVKRTIEAYDEHVYRWSNLQSGTTDVDTFVTNDNSLISWSETLKNHLVKGRLIEFDEEQIRSALYRPFVREHLYFEKNLNERRYLIPSIFPTVETERENLAIWIKVGREWPAFALMVDVIPDLLPQGGTQCFPFYTYDENGSYRRENITDWALEQFREHYDAGTAITKWDIFHYVYAVLHHPHYRERYAANLKRELPRIPFTPDFRSFAEIGKRLAEIHVNYEQQPEYPLERIETIGVPLDWRVEKMKLSKDKRSIIYNDFLKLSGIPAEVFEYRLGNRSALDWIIDQYQVSTDKRSGITNDPNRPDDPEYIVRLIGQVITVSVDTVAIVNALAALPILEDDKDG